MSVALVRSPTFLSHELFSFETIQHERFIVALPDSHPSAKQKSVRIKTLASEPLIVPPLQPGWGYADSMFQIFRDYGIVPRIAQEAIGALAVVTLVAGGFGVVVVLDSGALRMIRPIDRSFRSNLKPQPDDTLWEKSLSRTRTTTSTSIA
jgi:DNA-binding transcriptional LysR family regulator